MVTAVVELMVPGRRPVFVEVKASRPSGRVDLSKFFERSTGAAGFGWVFVEIGNAEAERPDRIRYAVAGPKDLQRFGRRRAS
ncbi:MAG: hypothetical protein ACO225_10725 [Ilumatobacteraceae bacterium]